MAVWDFVQPYDEVFRDWLSSEGYPCPAVAAGNHPPTAGEITAAAELLAPLLELHPLAVDCDEPRFDWNDPVSVATTFKVRGDRLGAWHLLLELSRTCGQILFLPASGEPGVVVQPGMDPYSIEAVYNAACSREDGWRYVFEKLYCPRDRVLEP